MCWAQGLSCSSEAGLKQWMPFASCAQRQVQGSCCWGLSFILLPVSHKKPLNCRPLLAGHAWRSGSTFGLDLLDFQSSGSVIVPSVTLSHVPCSQTDTAPKSSFMWREQWMIREVMWTLKLKLRARMRGLKEAKRRI